MSTAYAANGNRPADQSLVVVRVEDAIVPRLAGRAGVVYESPPQSRAQTIALVQMLVGMAVSRWETRRAAGSPPLPAGVGSSHCHRLRVDERRLRPVPGRYWRAEGTVRALSNRARGRVQAVVQTSTHMLRWHRAVYSRLTIV